MIFGPLGSRGVEAVKCSGQKFKTPTSQADQNYSQISTTTKHLLNAYAQGQEKWWIFRYLEFWNIREPYSGPWCEHLSTTVEWHNWIQRFLTWIESHQHDRTTIFEVIHIEYILINKVMYFNFQNMAALCDNNPEKPKFWFSGSPCRAARYPVIPCIGSLHLPVFANKRASLRCDDLDTTLAKTTPFSPHRLHRYHANTVAPHLY